MNNNLFGFGLIVGVIIGLVAAGLLVSNTTRNFKVYNTLTPDTIILIEKDIADTTYRYSITQENIK